MKITKKKEYIQWIYHIIHISSSNKIPSSGTMPLKLFSSYNIIYFNCFKKKKRR